MKDKILGGVFIFVSIIATLALIFSLSDIECKALDFSSDKLLDFIGIVVTTVALVIAVLLGVYIIDAYKRIKDIEIKHNDVSNKLLEMQKINENMHNIEEKSTEILYNVLDGHIEMAILLGNIKLRNELVIRQARLSYKFPSLNSEIRIKLLFELAYIGDSTDIDPVLNIINNEQGDIKLAAELVYDELRKKFT